MQVTITFRHMDPSQPMRFYALERLSGVTKRLNSRPIGGWGPLAVASNQRHNATRGWKRKPRRGKHQVRAHLPRSGLTHAVTHPISSGGNIEWLGMAKPAHVNVTTAKSIHRNARTTGAQTHHRTSSPLPAAPATPAINIIIREETFSARPLRVDDAVMQLSLVETGFLVFNDVDTGLISVVYRRKDGITV